MVRQVRVDPVELGKGQRQLSTAVVNEVALGAQLMLHRLLELRNARELPGVVARLDVVAGGLLALEHISEEFAVMAANVRVSQTGEDLAWPMRRGLTQRMPGPCRST